MDHNSSRAVNQPTKAGWQRMLVCLLVCVSGIRAASTAAATTAQKCLNKDPSLDEIIYYADVVVLGEVLRHIPDPNPDANTFTVEMKVYCVYKTKHPVPQKINITNAGSPSDACFTTEFELGTEYVTYLKEVNEGGKHVFTPSSGHSPSGYTDEIIVTCHIVISYPQGLDANTASRSCEPPADEYGDYEYEGDDEEKLDPCVPFEPEDKTTDVETPEVTLPETKASEAENGGDGSSTDPDAVPEKTEPDAEPKTEPDAEPKTKPDAEPKTKPETEPDVKVGTGGDSDNGDSGKEVPYQSGKTGKIENPVGDDGNSDSEPENGSVPLRMSLVLIALVYGVVLLLS